MKTLLFSINILALSFLSNELPAQSSLPDRPTPQRYVNDFVGLLSPGDVDYMESALSDFSKNSSNNLFIVIVKSLNRYEKSDFADKLIKKWNLGENASIILLKPKFGSEKGEIFIGYSSLLGNEISLYERDMVLNVDFISKFKSGEYGRGLISGTFKIMQLSSGKTNIRQPSFIQLPKETKRMLLFSLIYILFLIPSMWQIFVKAGQQGWACLVPIYNFLIFFKIIEKPWWWIFLWMLPYINFIWVIWGWNLLVQKFGKNVGFIFGVIFLGFIFIPILAFGEAKYNDNSANSIN